MPQPVDVQYAPPLTRPSGQEIIAEPGIRNIRVKSFTPSGARSIINDFNRKVEDASARVSKTVAEAAEKIEKEIPEFIKYLNDEVVPRAAALDKGAACGLGEAFRICRLHGETPASSEVAFLNLTRNSRRQRWHSRLAARCDFGLAVYALLPGQRL